MTATKSNDLRITLNGTFSNGEQWQAQIRLNDECKNGHEDFAITGDIWEKGKARTDNNLVTSGAIGDQLAKINKGFALINTLHLCDFNGVPMHATANMFYHIQNGFTQVEKSQKDDFCEYYRITPEQYDILSEAKEQDHFTALFLSMPEILDNWKKQAEEGIKFLEEKTGLKFESKATRSNLILPDAEKIELLKKRVKSGYYNKENSERRAKELREKKIAEKIQELKDGLAKSIKDETLDTEIKIALVSLFGTHDNVIFYKHTNTISFNYSDPQYATYKNKWTAEEVEQFKGQYDFGVSVEIKQNYK